MAKSSVLRPELEIYAKDTRKSNCNGHFCLLTNVLAALFGSVTVYLAGHDADYLRGRFMVANWDVGDLERHRNEIVEEGLLKNQPFKGNVGNGGHFTS